MKFSNTKILSLILVLTLAVVMIIIQNNGEDFVKFASAGYANEPIVIIDAGHGGFDGGAVADDNTLEKDLNLKIANILTDICISNGIRVITTRNGDSSLEDVPTESIRNRKNSDLRNRLKLMEKYENSIFISIHMNKFSDSSVHGAQIFYSGNLDDAKTLAETLRSYVNLFDENNNKTCKKGDSNAYLLHNAKCPAVIFECGFISNKDELNMLKTTEYQQKIAFSIFLGVTEYFNIKGC